MKQFLKIRQWSLPHELTLPFTSHFSVASNTLWQPFTHSRTSSKLVNTPKPCCCFISYMYVIFWILCCHFNNLHSIFTRSRFYLKKPLSLLIRSNSSSINILSWDCSNSVIPSGYISNSNSLAVFTSSAPSFTEVLNPSKSFMRVGINFFQAPFNDDILNSFYESWVFLMVPRIVDLF